MTDAVDRLITRLFCRRFRYRDAIDTEGSSAAVTGSKQIIVMRTDLGMRKGKMIAQGAHASMITAVTHRRDRRVRRWLGGPFAKICVRADSETQLRDIIADARRRGLLVAEVVDAGRTEFHGVPTLTCAAIGPDTPERLDPVTGGLKLL